MATDVLVNDELIERENRKVKGALDEDFDALGRQLARRGFDINQLVERALAFRIAVPSWGVGTGGTRFARFPGPGEPRTVFEKIDDCATLYRLVRSTPGVSVHIPWDKTDSPAELRAYARARGLHVEAMNSNTFQ